MHQTKEIRRRRERRHRVGIDALLVMPDQPVRLCRVTNANIYGCCLQLGEEGLPPSFHLVDLGEGNVVRAEVRWWRDDFAGLAFTEGWLLSTDAPGWVRDAVSAYCDQMARQAA